MAFSGNEEEPGARPRALVRYSIFGRRAEPVTAEEAFGEIARAFEAMADVPREEVGAAVEEFQELVNHPEHFQFFAGTREENPELFPDFEALLADEFTCRTIEDHDREVLSEVRTIALISYDGLPWESHQQVELLKRVADVVAQLGDGLVFDSQALTLCGRSFWENEVMLESGLQAINHTVIHYVSDESGGWVHTHGMGKFAQPDLELRGVPAEYGEVAGQLLMESAQWLIEGGSVEPDTAYAFGEHGVEWQFVEAEADPEQFSGAVVRLISAGDDPVNPARTTEALFAYAGGEFGPPPIQTEENDAEMQAAHEEAMATFGHFKERFRATQTEESNDAEFMVKISFPTPDGSKEFLWAAILDWSEGRITATLLNSPENVPDLQGGQEATVDESEVGDWMIVKQDRTWEGCYTDQVLLRRSGQEMPEKM